MPAPHKSLLDAGQCIQGAYDENVGAFRIETTPETGGTTEVSIDAADDSVRIGNGTGNFLAVNNDGSINVDVTGSTAYTNIVQYGEVDSVALGGTETVLTYTVPSGGSFYLVRVSFSGDCLGEFDLLINSATNMKKRLTYSEFNASFNYGTSALPGYLLSSGTTIQVVSTNYSPINIASFNATLEGVIST